MTAAGSCAVLLFISGCALLPSPAEYADPGPTAAPTSSAPTAETSAAEQVAAAELTAIDVAGGPSSIRVTVPPPAPGVPALGVPGGLLSAVCGVPGEAARYATISVTFTDRSPGEEKLAGSSNLRADVTVAGGSGIGVFERSDAERSDDAARYCPGTLAGGTSMQTEQLGQGYQTMTLYAVAPAAAATPDPFLGSSACPDDPNALCLPLG